METLQKICLALTILGAINWGFVGLFDINLVESIFGGKDSAFPNVIFALVALAGIINIGILVTPFEHQADRRK